MHLVAFTCVRDERDIIEPFVRHTLAFASQLTVLDRGSSDGTLGVLAALRSEGLPLTILHDESLGNDQAERMTGLLKLATTETSADWYLPLDADEFLQVAANAADALRYTDSSRPLALRWRGYVPHCDDRPNDPNPVRRIQHRRELPAWEDSKVLIPRALAVQAGVRLRQGSHGVLLDDLEIAPIEQPYLTLAHFPVRSQEQYLSKMTIRALQYRLTPNRNPACGWAFDVALAKALRDPGALAADFTIAARRYGLPEAFDDEIPVVHDPIDFRSGPLRYTQDRTTDAYRTLLGFVSQLTATPRRSVSQPEMTEDALRRERLMRDQAVAIRRLEQRVRELEAKPPTAKRPSWWRQAVR